MEINSLNLQTQFVTVDITKISSESVRLCDEYLLRRPYEFENILMRGINNDNVTLVLYLTNFASKYVTSRNKRKIIYKKMLTHAVENNNITIGEILFDYSNDPEFLESIKDRAIELNYLNFSDMISDKLLYQKPNNCMQHGICGVSSILMDTHGKTVPNSTVYQQEIATANPFYIDNIKRKDKQAYMLELLESEPI